MEKFTAWRSLPILFYLIFIFLSFNLVAQSPVVPTPGPAQTEPILITDATAHLGNGHVINNAYIAFENGKFSVVANQAVGRGFDGYKIISAEGKHLYPGFIAPNSQLGLREIDRVRATIDDREVGNFNPSVRALIAYNTDSELTATVRSNGVLATQIVPKGGRISGQSSVVQLDAWNWEDALIAEDGIHLNWPRRIQHTGWWAEPGKSNKSKKYDEQVREVHDFFRQAQAYSNKEIPAERNLHFEAMHSLFEGDKKLYVHANDARSITESILLAKQFELNLAIIGGRDSWMVAELLKENDVAVILAPPHRLPARQDSDIDQPYKTPAMLQDAGVLFCLSINGGMGGSWSQRNLPFQAGHTVAFGLDYEEAVQSISLNAAKILGVDDRMGSIETGKDATFFICEGDALDMRSCRITDAYIQGRKIDLDNKHKALYRKFKQKYEVR